MILKYWPILFCVLMMLASCGPKKKEPIFVDSHDPRASCSAQERAELTKKATEEYGFVILPKMADPEFKWFCFEIRRFINAIDLLPPKVRTEYERAQKKYGLKINVARNSVLEYDGIGPGVPAVGYYHADLRNPYIVIESSARKKTLWHETGHFLDQAMSLTKKGCWGSDLSSRNDFKKKYYIVKDNLKQDNDNLNFMTKLTEGFADSFAFYISNQVEEGRVGDPWYNDFYPLFEFFDDLFDDMNPKDC